MKLKILAVFLLLVAPVGVALSQVQDMFGRGDANNVNLDGLNGATGLKWAKPAGQVDTASTMKIVDIGGGNRVIEGKSAANFQRGAVVYDSSVTVKGIEFGFKIAKAS